MSADLIIRRQLSPTSLNDDGKIMGATRSGRRRKQQTKTVAMQIHGATTKNMLPAYEGLLSVLNSAPLSDLKNIVMKSPKVVKKVIPKIVRKNISDFENTKVNFTRSVNVLYRGGIASKAKYCQIRSSLIMHKKENDSHREHIEVMQNVHIPRLLTYQKLVREINKIDIGTLHDVRETLCDGLREEEKVDGKYRDLLKYLLRLAKFYLFVNKQRTDKLEWFGEGEGSFKVAIGGDGAPFGKDDQALAWLVSFVNCGKRISSPEENHLLFGANCPEDCLVAKRYICMLSEQMREIETNTYSVLVDGVEKNVNFKFELLPNDMKYLAFIGGELSISATYFSPFADVNSASIVDLKGKFGTDPSCKWKPWKYSDRVKVVTAVEKKKQELSKTNLQPKTVRTKLTTFIAQKKSRQEFEPLVGQIIDKAKAEPLHLKNNAWQHWHLFVMRYVLKKCELSHYESVNDIPPTSMFSRYYSCIKSTIKATRLAKKIRKWWLDGRTKNQDLEYRFTGKESRLFSHNFMKLILSLQSEQDDKQASFQLHVFAFIAINLRNSISLFNRHQITDEELKALSGFCSKYFKASSLFLKAKPTSWTIGHVVPVHARQLHEKLGMGLGINNMEGREAKHVVLAKFARNSLQSSRWHHVFKHEFISLIWLRENGYDTTTYKCSSDVYIPKRCLTPEFCHCGEPKNVLEFKCAFCSDKIQNLIEDCVTKGVITNAVKEYI